MRIKSSIVVILIALLSMVTFVSCSDNAGESSGGQNSILVNSASQVFRDISGLKNFRANINSSTAAVGKQEQAVSRDVSRSLDSYLNYLLVKVDEGKTQAEPVTFTANTNTKINGRTIHAGDMITQDKLTGSVDKVYVLGDYTLVSFLTVDALTLINSKDTAVQSNSYNTWYSGNLNFSSNDSNNGGTNEYIWYQYYVPNNKSNEETFNIEYTYSTWWRDSNGRHNSEEIRYRDDLTLRCAANNVPAFNEYNGVAVYDTFDYYTSDFRSSFIIDNNTGLIYSIPYGQGDDRVNLSVHQGVVIDKNLGPVKLSINGSGELELEQILANKNIYIYDVFKDSYDQYYIRTDSLSLIDGDVLFYIVSGEYVPTEDGRVIHISYNNANSLDTYWLYQITDLSFVGRNFVETPITTDDEVVIDFLTYLPNSYNSYYDWVRGLYDYNQKNGFEFWQMNNSNRLVSGAKAKFQCVVDGMLYLQGISESELYASQYNLTTKDILYSRLWGYNGDSRYALLDGKNCIIARKQSNNLFSISQFDPNTIYIQNGERSIMHNDGVREYYSNNEYERIWRFAYENNIAEIYVPYTDPETGIWMYAGRNRSYGTEYYQLQINGEYKDLIFKAGYNYSTARDNYINSMGQETLLLSDVSATNWYGYDNALKMTFNVTSKNGTNSYKIVKDGEDSYKAVLASSSTVTTTTLTLQPINR